MIPKEGKDRVDYKGCRPVSVLNSVYKLCATILAKRMEPVMPLLIDKDQTGFIKNRQTQDNIRRLHTIVQINKDQISVIILSLDAEKAFDSVGWEFLYLVMKRFNFSKDFIHCIQALYALPTARIKVYGSLSDFITLQCGCRQLRPLVYWCNSYVAKWKKMELSLTDTPIQSLLGCVGMEKKILHMESQ